MKATKLIISFVVILAVVVGVFIAIDYMRGTSSDSSCNEVGRGYIQDMDAADFSFDSLATIQAWVEQNNNAADRAVIDSCREKMELLEKVQQALKDHDAPTLYALKSALSPNQQAIVDSFYHRTHNENQEWKSDTIQSEFNSKTFSSIQDLDYQPTSQADEVPTSTDEETQPVREKPNPDKTTYNNYLQQLQGTTFKFSDLAAMEKWIKAHSTLDKDRKLSVAIARYQKIYYNLQHENFENISSSGCTDEQKKIINNLKMLKGSRRIDLWHESRHMNSALTFKDLNRILNQLKNIPNDEVTPSVKEKPNPDKTTYNNYLQQLQGTTFKFSDLAAMKQWINAHSTLDKDKKLSVAIARYQNIYYNLQHENFEKISSNGCTQAQKNIIDKLKDVRIVQLNYLRPEIKDMNCALTFNRLNTIINNSKILEKL